MKLVKYTDADGYNRQSLVRNAGDDPEQGIPQDPPDLSQIDWQGVQRDLHNELVTRELITFRNVSKSPGGLGAAVVTVLKNRLVHLYRGDS